MREIIAELESRGHSDLSKILLGLMYGSTRKSIEARSDFGKGWFYNTNKRKLIKIDSSDLGPHGDHDGWITIGDNARKIGVDPKKARAFQDASFGFMVKSKKDPFYPYADEDGYVDPNDPSLLENKDFLNLFKKKYGMSIEDARNIRFPQLIRIRLWPRGFLSIDLPEDVTNKHVKYIHDIIYKLGDEIRRVNTVGLCAGDYGYGGTVSLQDLLDVKNLRDLKNLGVSFH